MFGLVTASCQKWPPAPSAFASRRKKPPTQCAFCKRLYKKHRDWDERTVYRERVIIRERPRHYREREVHHHYYQQPMPSYGYGYSRSPALVIGVNIPPLIIPLN